MTRRLAIVTTHPIQYYAPWFAMLAKREEIELKVFYLWNPKVSNSSDPGFQQKIEWDIPLLEGYHYEFVPNSSKNPGTHHFEGINNPGLSDALSGFNPSAVLLLAYNYRGLIPFIFRWKKTPLLFRGDSHRLVPSSGIKARLRRFVVQSIFARFAACLYVGHANREYFQQHAVPANRLFHSPHAVDSSRFGSVDPAAAQRWRESLGIQTDDLVFLFAGKFQKKKRPDLLLAAFLKSHPNSPTVHLVFLGSGAMEKEIRDAAGAESRVHFLPFQNQSDMPAALSMADVVVLPSEGPGETWGLIINEAQSLAKAVIVSNHVGCAADLVAAGEDGSPGRVFTAGSVEALSEAITSFGNDRRIAGEMGRAGLARVSGYSYEAATTGLLRALDVVVPR